MPNELFEAEPVKDDVPETSVAIANKEDAMLSKVLESGNIDVLKEFVALRNAQEERQARIAFDADFVKLQSGLPSVAKSKENKGTHSMYAEIETIQAKWYPVVHQHGFACSWRYEPLNNGDLRVFIDLSKHGHTRTTYVDMPPIGAVKSHDGNAVQNPLQVQGVRMSYGRRYSLIAALGGVIEGEDSDGQITDDMEQLRLELSALCELRDGSGKLKLPQNAFDIINAELKKPVEQMDVTRMKAFYKRAKTMVEAVK